MFAVGDKIMYGSEGVFSVAEYTSSPIDKNDTRVFYVLRPVSSHSSNSMVIAPSEGGAAVIRPVIGREEALALIESIPKIETVTVERERMRREVYRAVMSGGRCEDFVSIIKTVRIRRAEFAAQKRRLAETDTDFEGRAYNCLLGELSVALDTEREQVADMVMAKLISE